MEQKLEEALKEFVVWVYTQKDAWLTDGDSENTERRDNLQVGYDVRPKFIRIWIETWGSKSVYCFLNSQNGDLLKGSWKSPVKNGVRGNIYKGLEEWEAKFYWHGPKYLR